MKNGRPVIDPSEACGYYMPLAKEPCARTPGHTSDHATRYALDNAMASKRKAAA